MTLITRWTSDDLAHLPELPGVRYEILDGDLYVATAPSFDHQYALDMLGDTLRAWSRATGRGLAMSTPGLIFAPDQNAIPDLIWISAARLQGALDAARHFIRAPELVVEILSPGALNEHRDTDRKRSLYGRQGVEEYWIVDPQARTVTLYHLVQGVLEARATLGETDTLTSPLLPGFACPVASLWPPSALPV